MDSSLTRVQPNVDDGSRYIGNQDALLEWVIAPSLADELILNAGDFPIQLAIEGNQTVNNNYTELVVAFYYDENQGGGRQLIASGSFADARYDNGIMYDVSYNFNLATELTIPAGSSLILTLDNITYNASSNNVRGNNLSLIHISEPTRPY